MEGEILPGWLVRLAGGRPPSPALPPQTASNCVGEGGGIASRGERPPRRAGRPVQSAQTDFVTFQPRLQPPPRGAARRRTVTLLAAPCVPAHPGARRFQNMIGR
jgi:hypothetical protein